MRLRSNRSFTKVLLSSICDRSVSTIFYIWKPILTLMGKGQNWKNWPCCVLCIPILPFPLLGNSAHILVPFAHSVSPFLPSTPITFIRLTWMPFVKRESSRHIFTNYIYSSFKRSDAAASCFRSIQGHSPAMVTKSITFEQRSHTHKLFGQIGSHVHTEFPQLNFVGNKQTKGLVLSLLRRLVASNPISWRSWRVPTP